MRAGGLTAPGCGAPQPHGEPLKGSSALTAPQQVEHACVCCRGESRRLTASGCGAPRPCGEPRKAVKGCLSGFAPIGLSADLLSCAPPYCRLLWPHPATRELSPFPPSRRSICRLLSWPSHPQRGPAPIIPSTATPASTGACPGAFSPELSPAMLYAMAGENPDPDPDPDHDH